MVQWDRMDNRDGSTESGMLWDFPFCPLLPMVQWDGMDNWDGMDSPSLPMVQWELSWTVVRIVEYGTPSVPLDGCWQCWT